MLCNSETKQKVCLERKKSPQKAIIKGSKLLQSQRQVNTFLEMNKRNADIQKTYTLNMHYDCHIARKKCWSDNPSIAHPFECATAIRTLFTFGLNKIIHVVSLQCWETPAAVYDQTREKSLLSCLFAIFSKRYKEKAFFSFSYIKRLRGQTSEVPQSRYLGSRLFVGLPTLPK